jgi:hypothetical protein
MRDTKLGSFQTLVNKLPTNDPLIMAEKIYNLDLANLLKTDEAIDIFLADAFEIGDARHIASALNIVSFANARRLKRPLQRHK